MTNLTLVGGFFIALLLVPAHADGITVTEVKKPVMCSWKDERGAQFSVKCAYLTHLWIRAKRGCPECAWKQKRI